jgi:PAS domain-containing protein
MKFSKGYSRMDFDSTLLAEIVDKSPFHIYAKDKSLKLVYCNQAVAETFDTTVDSMIGTNDTNFISASDDRSIADADRQVVATGQAVTIDVNLHVKGEVISFRDHKYPIIVNGEPGVAGIAYKQQSG